MGSQYYNYDYPPTTDYPAVGKPEYATDPPRRLSMEPPRRLSVHEQAEQLRNHIPGNAHGPLHRGSLQSSGQASTQSHPAQRMRELRHSLGSRPFAGYYAPSTGAIGSGAVPSYQHQGQQQQRRPSQQHAKRFSIPPMGKQEDYYQMYPSQQHPASSDHRVGSDGNQTSNPSLD